MFSLQNKTALITGGGSGIGKAIALTFARQGAWVFIFDLDENSCRLVQEEISREGGRCHYICCDITDQQQVSTAVKQVAEQTGYIHILVNNAGIAHIGTVETTAEQDLQRVLAVNVYGAYNLLHEVIPVMKEKGGVVLNLASIAALIGLPDRFAYTVSKGAIAGMTLSVAKDYLSYNIRCNSISPARVHTPFVDGYLAKNYPGREAEMFEKLSKTQPIGRMGLPEEVASLALFLCSDEAAFITGCDYPLDGGFTTLNN